MDKKIKLALIGFGAHALAGVIVHGLLMVRPYMSARKQLKENPTSVFNNVSA